MAEVEDNPVQRGGSGSFINRILGGRYEAMETLGQGPLLAAYRARDRQQNRIVTVKTLLPAFAHRPEVLESLRVGLGQTLSLSHPNITRTFDVGKDESSDTLFLVEEFVRGIDLKERIRRAAPFQLTAATETAISVAEGLEFAHSRNVAHGDVRPQNIRVAPEGQVKLTNFGIAPAQCQAIAGDAVQWRRVADYHAPEIGVNSAPTASADLYALGVVLFEMLTGETPYPADDPAEIARRRMQEPVPSPRSVNAAVPTALDGITRKALSKTPEERYATATELLRDLRQVRDALRFGKSLSWSPLTDETRTEAAVRVVAPPRAFEAEDEDLTVVQRPASASKNQGSTLPPPVTAPPPSRIETIETVSRSATPVDAITVAKAGKGDDRIAEKKESENLTSAPSSGGGRWLTALIWTAALGFVCALCFLAFIILQFLKPTSDVVVPNLVGKPLAEAQNIATQTRFNLAIVDKQYRDAEPEGVIYQMGTTPGRHIKEGRDVQIWVSKGPRLVEIPDLIGMDFEKARTKLESVGLRLGDYKGEYDYSSAKGTVIRQKPSSGENAARGARIDLTISKGEEPTPTPEPIPTPDMSTPAPETTPSANLTGESDSAKTRTFDITYPPNGPLTNEGAPHQIRIDVIDDRGANTVYNELKPAGSTVKFRAEAVGKKVSIKLYDNDDLKAEVNK
ncbi:MAG: PASTA domain-containing protein [bacterium]